MATFAPPSDPAISAAHSRAATTPTTPVSPSSPPVRRTRTASITQSIMDTNPHYGICAATGDALASAPSLKDLRRNSAGSIASRSRATVGRRGSSASATSPGVGPVKRGESFPIHEEREAEVGQPRVVDSLAAAAEQPEGEGSRTASVHEDTGKPGWWPVTVQGLLAFWGFFKTPMGFFITIYMLNVVAWGGMLFLLLCNASPAMCKPTCNDINSPRRVWIEIDSQILNALFCVTGFGLIPWRFRDLYFLLKWRVGGKKSALERLAKIHEGWFRVPREGVEAPAVDRGRLTEEEGEALAETETGLRAPPTASWKMDFVVWLYVWNTFFQAVLSGFMWGMNRINRPSWSTGLFVALACIVAGVAGWMVWHEGKNVKKIEGEKGKEEGKEEVAEEKKGELVKEKIEGETEEKKV